MYKFDNFFHLVVNVAQNYSIVADPILSLTTKYGEWSFTHGLYENLNMRTLQGLLTGGFHLFNVPST